MPLPLLARMGVAAGSLALGGARRLGGAGWQLQSWSDLFSRYYPSLSNTVKVEAQGGPRTPLNTVVHMALAAAFGTCRFHKLSHVNLKVGVSHTENAVEVTFTVANVAFIDALEMGLRLIGDQIDNFIPELPEPEDLTNAEWWEKKFKQIAEFDPIGAGGAAVRIAERERLRNDLMARVRALQEQARAALERGDGIEAEIAREALRRVLQEIQDRKQMPGVRRKGGPEDALLPPTSSTNLDGPAPDAAASKVVFFALKAYREASRNLGQEVIYHLGRHEIRGGPAPHILKPFVEKAGGDALGALVGGAGLVAAKDGPFTDLNGQLLMTRDPHLNPQMPTGPHQNGLGGFGTDLRSLVAQVLHDPGVRPPAPQTASGPPPVNTEEFGT